MPISGGIIAAREGTLSLMVGGTESTLERVLPVFRVFARDITHTGAVGSGQAAKLAHQLVFSVNVNGAARRAGAGRCRRRIPGSDEVRIETGPRNSTVLQVWHDLGPRWKGMLEPTAPGAPLPNMRKGPASGAGIGRVAGHAAARSPTIASQVADSGTAIGHNDPLL